MTEQPTPDPSRIRSILATDCGSTTTKAILIEAGPDGYRLALRGEAPTTVEAPFDDVTVGVINAVTELQELTGGRIMGFGGGGYNRANLAAAWCAVLDRFIRGSE